LWVFKANDLKWATKQPLAGLPWAHVGLENRTSPVVAKQIPAIFSMLFVPERCGSGLSSGLKLN
jgi:hypothetical protein